MLGGCVSILVNLVLLFYCWYNLNIMLTRDGDTISLRSEVTDFDSIGNLSLDDAVFMPILILKNAYTFANHFDPEMSKYLTIEALRYDTSPEH